MKSEFKTIQYNNNLPARIEFIQGVLSAEPHWHKEIELVYVAEGALKVEKHGRIFTLNSGEVFLINSGEIHQLSAEGEAEFLSLHLSYDFAKQFDAQLDAVMFELNNQAKQSLKPLLQELTERRNMENQTFKQYAVLMDIFHILFTDCRRQKRISLYGNAKSGERNAKIAVEHIEQHYRENLSLNSMAQLLGLHPIYFSKYFKEVTGTGFNTYVNTVRMKHALDDLIRHGMTIADAAKANGFSNVKSFETICKRSYGLTPLQFKKQQLMVS